MDVCTLATYLSGLGTGTALTTVGELLLILLLLELVEVRSMHLARGEGHLTTFVYW